MDKKLIFKIIVSIVVVFIIGIILKERIFVSKSEGTIQIVIIDENNNTIKDNLIRYYEGDTLVSILNENYDCLIENGMLLNLDTLITPTDWSYYIGIYKNGEMSNVGVNELEFQDGDVISFVFTDASIWIE